MAWLEDLETVLIDAGVVVANEVRFSSKSAVATGAGPYITISATGGVPPQAVQSDPLAYRYPGAQVLVRAGTHPAARDKAQAALLALGSVRNQSINGTFYRSITLLQSEPFDMGLDDTGRIVMAFNVLGDRRS